jgi:succinate dehydrogenase flavin-adding protein (antitoxin of CptAB toxin-antitoxin module)
MIPQEVKGGLDQVETETSQNFAEEKFKERIFNGMKENLMLSLISFIFNHILDSVSADQKERAKMEKDFINFWKKNILEITQEQIKQINDILNEGNVDMLNIIVGKNKIADVEDYQNIINSSIKETEAIFWKICGKSK